MWPLRDLLAEVGRNLRVAHLPLLVLLAVTLLSAGWFEAGSVASLVDRYRTWLAEGGMVVSIERDQGIDGRQCAAAATDGAVVASGGAGLHLASGATIRFNRSPGVDYTVLDMTQGALEIVAGTPPARGWIIGQTALSELGVGVGDVIGVGPEYHRVVLALGSGPRQLGYDRDVVRIVPAVGNRFSICWVEMDPAAFGIGPDIVAARFPSDSVVRPFRRTLPGDHPSAFYRNRPSQMAWLVAGSAVGLTWFGWWWVRRREFVLYRSLGVCRAGLVIMAIAEAALVTFFAGAVAGALLVLFAQTSVAWSIGVWTIGAAVVVGILASFLMVVPVVWRNVAAAARDS